MKKIILFLAFIVMPFFTFAAFPIEYNDNLDITITDKKFELKNNTVTISATRPIKPMQEFTIIAKFDKDNIQSIDFAYNMEMNMGKFEYKGIKISNNEFIVKQILTKCMSGRTKWYSKAIITYIDNSNEELYFFFDVK